MSTSFLDHFSHILDHFGRISRLCAAQHAPRALPFVVSVLIGYAGLGRVGLQSAVVPLFCLARGVRSADMLACFDKTIGEANQFQINLAIHPQVVLQNVLRQEYLHLEAGQMQTADENLPWGPDAMITLQFLDTDVRQKKTSIRPSPQLYATPHAA